MEALQLIEVKRAEVLKRVTKLRAQLDAAESELRNLEITAETLSRYGLNPFVETAVPRGHSFTHILNTLSDNEEEGLSPKEIHDALTATGVTTISQDNVRTLLSRNREKICTKDGRYWRRENEPPSANASGSEMLPEQQQKEIPEC